MARSPTPHADYFGADSFTWKVSDGALDSRVATARLTITAVNDAPVAQSTTYTTAEDNAARFDLAATDVDTPAASLGYVLVSGPAHGTLTLSANGQAVYTPNADYYGPDSFSFKVNDGLLDSNTATVHLNITPVNDAPTLANQTLALAEDTVLTGSLLASASDVDSAVLAAAILTMPAHGTLNVNTDGTFSYRPFADYFGADSFTYKVTDGELTSNTATISLSVSAVNDAPVLANATLSAPEDTALNIDLRGYATDVDSPALTPTIVTGPQHGTLTLNADGSYTYLPTLNYNGSDSFTFKLSDGALDSNIATVTISVAAVNDAPVANASVTTPTHVTRTV